MHTQLHIHPAAHFGDLLFAGAALASFLFTQSILIATTALFFTVLYAV